ncbi:MAG: MBL fold metallo-hydrolase [Ignavibacteria bacterium]|nr:MBL fold metallo-hydrolase [Ignavibacteria bacterium]
MNIYKTIFFIALTSILMLPNLYSQENMYKYNVENTKVFMLSEGQHSGSASFLVNASEDVIKKYLPDGKFPMATNCYLIVTDNHRILVDAGYGRELPKNLDAVGYPANTIDIVLLTHMHGDHIGGLIDEQGNIAFPNAMLYIATTEADYWMEQNNKSAVQVIEKYKLVNKLHLYEPQPLSNALVPLLYDENYIYAIAAFGHTPGHTVFQIGNRDKMLIWGDLTHAMAVQMPYPNISMTFDVSPKDAAVTRKNILDYVSANKIVVAGMHIAYPGIGYIESAGSGYVFNPMK